jgi:hypothetical protein
MKVGQTATGMETWRAVIFAGFFPVQLGEMEGAPAEIFSIAHL